MRTLIQKGTVYDGTGAEGFTADVLVQDDKIEAVAPHIDAEVDTVIDAAGLAVTPGFIDTHRHCDTAALVDRIETIAVPQLERTEGVRAVALQGAPGQRITIDPDDAALAAA